MALAVHAKNATRNQTHDPSRYGSRRKDFQNGRGIHRRGGAHGRRTQGRAAQGLASGRSGRRGDQCAARPRQGRSEHGRGRDLRLRQPGRRAGDQRRAQRHSRLAPAPACARHQRRPPMRLLAAGAAFRCAGRDERRDGCRDRNGRRKHDARADGFVGGAAGAERLRHLYEPGDRQEISERPVLPVHGRGDDGREVQALEGHARRVRLSEPPEGDRGDAGRTLRGRNRAARGYARRWLEGEAHGR